MGRNKQVRSSAPAPTDRPTSTRPVPLAPPPRRPAVFLDRDGTIITDTGYIDDPKKVELLPGAATAIARLRGAGYLAVIVSNQSGVARGKFDEAKMNEVHGRVVEVLGEIDDPGMEIEIAVRKYGVPHEFAEAAQREAEALPDAVRDADLAGRIDLREEATVFARGVRPHRRHQTHRSFGTRPLGWARPVHRNERT